MVDSFPEHNRGSRLSFAQRSNSVCTGFIFDIKKYAIHDGPGIRTTVFFKGCPLKCRWCHNPESWKMRPEPAFRAGRCVGCGRCLEVCRAEAISFSDGKPVTDGHRCIVCGECVNGCVNDAREILGWETTVPEVMSEIKKDVIFYDESGGGVTFSGGEPLLQHDFLMALLDGCRKLGIHTGVDTSCCCKREILKEVAAKADLFLCDIKHMDNGLHERLTGVGNELILGNIAELARQGKRIIIRIPVIPGFNDDEANISRIAAFAAKLAGLDRIDILPYNSGGNEKSVRLTGQADIMATTPPSETAINSISRILREHGFEVKTGG